MTAQEIVKQQRNIPTRQEETRSAARVLLPAVDIFESEDALTLLADMPGVDKEKLEIKLEKGILTINGEVSLGTNGTSLMREFPASNYYRQFKLSDYIDTDKSTAKLHNGVLTLTIPKAEAAKPKKIEIRH